MLANKNILLFGFFTILIIIMGLFNFFKGNEKKKFVSEKDFKKNLAKQIEMTPMTIEQLRKIDVKENKELKLEFFFYTNTSEKASALESELKQLNYSVESKISASNKNEFIITGWTTKMAMADSIVVAWTSQMCETGYKHDCEFDGWGTSPDQ